MTRIPFTKMEGAGNDYIYVDGIRCAFPMDRAPALSRGWSDRHFGIGADGLIVLQRGATAPVRMIMWNADGSRGAMCGNGLRCLARLAFDHGHVNVRRFDVQTDSGLRTVEISAAGDSVRTTMGDVKCGAPTTIDVAGRRIDCVPGDAGNPHAVIFVDDVESAAVAEIGAAMQSHARFPGGVNVEFVQVVAPELLLQRTFERGSGETLACGTGAAVAAVAARQLGHAHAGTVVIRLRGGELRIHGAGSSLAIEGPVSTVFTGEIDVPDQPGR